MVSQEIVDEQLRRIDVSFRFWGRAEMLELKHILIPGEQIQVCINGRYEGGFAMLCSTDQRLLLIDKKPMYLTLEDLRYDMVSEVDFSHRLFDASIHVMTPTKTLRFTSWNKLDLRKMTAYLQHRVMEIRQHQVFQNQLQQQFVQSQAQPQQQPATQSFVQQIPAIVPQATVAATSTVPQLPMPTFANHYAKSPLIMRKRISRFQR